MSGLVGSRADHLTSRQRLIGGPTAVLHKGRSRHCALRLSLSPTGRKGLLDRNMP
jgi:hypothetical protein